MVIFASIPNAAIEEGAQIKLVWVFPRDESLLQN
jgi:hypothetical protein